MTTAGDWTVMGHPSRSYVQNDEKVDTLLRGVLRCLHPETKVSWGLIWKTPADPGDDDIVWR
jgi:hypothetical protein